jgi:hypothetical protein
MDSSSTVLGLFEEIEPAADALKGLTEVERFAWQDLMVLSSIPFPEGVLESDKSKSNMPLITLVFAFVGIAIGLLLAGGSFALYVIRQGAKPVLSGPPIGIISYEFMMLAALSAAFFCALYEMRLPAWRARVTDPRISEGLIGIAAYCADGPSAERAEALLIGAGAVDVRRDARSFD